MPAGAAQKMKAPVASRLVVNIAECQLAQRKRAASGLERKKGPELSL
jgi:hypothetical protein